MFLPIIYVLIASCFFFLFVLRLGLGLEAIGLSAFSWLLLFFLAEDLRHARVPQRAALFGIIFGLIFGLYKGIEFFHVRLLGALFGFLCIWCVLVVSTYVLRRASLITSTEFGLGFGDALLLSVIGANEGVLVLPPVLFLASVQGVLFFALSRTSKYLRFYIPWPGAHDQLVPFGAFLCLSTLELAVWPQMIAEIMSFIRSSI